MINYCMQAGAGDYLYVSTVKQSNEFTHVVTLTWWSRCMAGPRSQGGDLPAEWVRGRWAPDTWIRPQYCRLPVGHVFAAFVLPIVNRGFVDMVSNMW